MNPKQTVPLLAAGSTFAPAAPVILIGVAAIFALAWLFSDDKKPEAPPADAEKRDDTISTPVAPHLTFTPAPIPPPTPKPAPAPAPVAAAKPPVASVSPAPAARRARRDVTREDLTAIFNHGTRALTRTAAVSALKALGFGKTAAYKAFSMDGRFAPWLQFAPDGKIICKG